MGEEGSEEMVEGGGGKADSDLEDGFAGLEMVASSGLKKQKLN